MSDVADYYGQDVDYAEVRNDDDGVCIHGVSPDEHCSICDEDESE